MRTFLLSPSFVKDKKDENKKQKDTKKKVLYRDVRAVLHSWDVFETPSPSLDKREKFLQRNKIVNTFIKIYF